ncbi:hypothetical protein FJNA_13780 [Thermus sp. FJN-A]
MTPVDNLWITLWITGVYLWITLWTTCGKIPYPGSLWITGRLSTGYPQPKAGYPQGFSTTPFPSRTGFFPRYPHIHSPYYYGYYLFKIFKKTLVAVKGRKPRWM